ncbi:MAG: DNA polymerase III subunit delta [Clostridiales bacterium]|jgi:DNA polymerase-3 subunit delta|nr:DNA polymerase III subunit delta [Clostridiales bacterium]
MSLDVLKRELKENTIRRLYLFYGPEAYLARHYAGEIEKRAVSEFAKTVSLTVFEGRPDLESVYEACQAYPLFGDRRMVVLKDSGLLKPSQRARAGGGDQVGGGDQAGDESESGENGESGDGGGGSSGGGGSAGGYGGGAVAAGDAGNSAVANVAGPGSAYGSGGGIAGGARAAKKPAGASARARGSAGAAAKGAARPGAITFEAIVSELPDTTCLLIVEKDVDKRLKLYSLISKAGLAVEFPLQKPPELERWVANIAERSGKRFERGAQAYFMEKSEDDMTAIKSELDKLLMFMGERSRITMGDIAAVCSFSLKARIFDLMDAVVAGQKLKAMAELRALAEQKEPAIRIMSMLSGHLALLRHMKAMSLRGMQLGEITELMKLNPYRAKILWRQCRRCQPASLDDAMKKCYNQDLAVKSGRLDKDAALELLVASLRLT